MSELSTTSGLDPVAAQRWAERIARFAASNVSATAFCAAEGIAKSGFFRWRRKLSPNPRNANTTKPPRPIKPTIRPIHVMAPASSTTSIELVRPDGSILRFPTGTAPELIIAILRALETPSC